MRYRFSFKPFMPRGLLYLKSLDRSISNRRGIWLFFLLLPCFVEIPVHNSNSVNPDQTSDQGLQYLPMSLLWDARINGLKMAIAVQQSITYLTVIIDSRRAVVSFWQTNVHKYWLTA